MEREGDETLLGAVVEVALEPAALCDTRLDDPGARGRQLIVGLRALEGERDELREVGETLLCLGRKGVWLRREDEERAPEALSGGDGSNDRGSIAGLTGEACGLAGQVGVVVDAAAFVRGAIHGTVRVAVGHVESDLDAATLAVAP